MTERIERILYVGNFDPPFSTENHVRASLLELGRQVSAVQENRTDTRALERIFAKHDLFLFTRTWGLRGADVAWMQNIPIRSASFHLDLYAGLPRGRNIGRDPFFRTQHVFTPDGGSEAFFREAGVHHHYLKPGVFGPECYMADATADLTADVCFVGSYDYHAEWPYRRRLVDFLRETYGPRFAKHGGPETHIRGGDLNRLYASVKVVVGDTLCPGFDHSFYWSDRIYETLGRGGFLIHPYVFGLEEEFRDREHVVFYRYGDFGALRRLIDHYLTHDEERERIRRAGHQLVKSKYTYTQRMQTLLDTLESTPGRPG